MDKRQTFILAGVGIVSLAVVLVMGYSVTTIVKEVLAASANGYDRFLE